MEWWSILGWIFAVLLGIPAAVYYWHRLKLDWAKDKERRRKIFIRAREELLRIKEEIEQCQYPKYREYREAPPLLTYENITFKELAEGREPEEKEIPKYLQKMLKNILNILNQYEIWLPESKWIIRTKINEECRKRESLLLLSLWRDLNPHGKVWRTGASMESILPYVLENLTSELEGFILPLIDEKRLDAEQVGKLFCNKFPDLESHINEVGDGEKVITTEGFVKHKDFRRLIENLKKLEKSPSIQETRKYRQESLLEINKVLKKRKFK